MGFRHRLPGRRNSFACWAFLTLIPTKCMQCYHYTSADPLVPARDSNPDCMVEGVLPLYQRGPTVPARDSNPDLPLNWLQRQESNLRQVDYETTKLPLFYPAIHGSPVRLLPPEGRTVSQTFANLDLQVNPNREKSWRGVCRPPTSPAKSCSRSKPPWLQV